MESMLHSLFALKGSNELIAVRAIKGEEVLASEYVHTVQRVEEFAQKYAQLGDVYFGACTRKIASPLASSALKAYFIWVDLDVYHRKKATTKKAALKEAFNEYVLPPSIIVNSGGGFHLYWMLDDPCSELQEVEQVNTLLEKCIDGAGTVGDRARIMRIDSTFNHKRNPLRAVTLIRNKPLRYSLRDIRAATKVSQKIRNKIVSGDGRGFKTKSERDWRIVLNLVQAGLSDEAITQIFNAHKIGDKFRQRPPKGGEAYFKHTLKKARENSGISPENVEAAEEAFAGIFEEDDCYWIILAKGAKSQLSTFTFEPRVLLCGESETDTDTLVGTIRASGYEWPDIPLTRKAFVRSDSLIRELPLASWQWLASDSTVKALLPYLMEKLRSKGLPKRTATSQVGYFKGFWLGSSQTMSPDGIIAQDDKEVSVLPSKGERPKVSYVDTLVEAPMLEEFFRLFMLLNDKRVVWPVLGWLAACPFKSRLAEQKVRFPALNLFGTRGSGKTSLITQVMQPFMGYDDSRTYDCTTTKFVILSLFGSTNGVPIAFSEYRSSLQHASKNILRYLLLAYDSGHDPRGRPDQTVVDYVLDAPFSVDGEDALRDAASLERIVQVNMHPEDIVEGSAAFDAFQEIVLLDLKAIGSAYLRFSLSHESDWTKAMMITRKAFPQQLPDRVRRNLAVAVEGLRSMKQFAMSYGAAFPKVSPSTVQEGFAHCLENIVNAATGRSSILVDEFVEDLINEISLSDGVPKFIHKYDNPTNIVWFHLSTTMNWWLVARRMQNKATLDSAAIKSQLRERHSRNGSTNAGQYIVGREARAIDGKTFWAYGIDLTAAHEVGLDVPVALDFFRVSTTTKSKQERKEKVL